MCDHSILSLFSVKENNEKFNPTDVSIRWNRYVISLVLCLMIIVGFAHGDVLVRLSNIDVPFMGRGVQYSPNGQLIAICYVDPTLNKGRIAILDQESGQPLPILYTNPPDSGAHSFCWKSNDSLIISMRSYQSRNWDLYCGWVYGGTLRNITNTTSHDECWPKVSHDEHWLVYADSITTTHNMSIRLRNLQIQGDSGIVIYSGPYKQTHFCWCYNDTMFAYESLWGSTTSIFFFSNPPYGGISLIINGEDPSFAPYGQDFTFMLRYSTQTESDIWLSNGPHGPYNLTGSYSEISGMKSDPDWCPSTAVDNRIIFIKKHQVGNVWKGDVWMVFDIDLGIAESPEQVPIQYQVGQAYPNPFNSTAIIPFELNTPSVVSWELFNVLGQRILQTSPGTFSRGLHRIVIQGDQLTSGNYWLSVRLGSNSEVRKLILLK
jgi:hypothetical protein